MTFLDRLFCIERLESAIAGWNPADRRRWAVRVGVWTVLAMVVNVALYVAGIIGERSLILVTLILSWLAVTFTCLDLVATTDVRKEVD